MQPNSLLELTSDACGRGIDAEHRQASRGGICQRVAVLRRGLAMFGGRSPAARIWVDRWLYLFELQCDSDRLNDRVDCLNLLDV